VKSGDNHVVMNMTKFLEYIRSEVRNAHGGDEMDKISCWSFKEKLRMEKEDLGMELMTNARL
jgi:hypothetical protein